MFGRDITHTGAPWMKLINDMCCKRYFKITKYHKSLWNSNLQIAKTLHSKNIENAFLVKKQLRVRLQKRNSFKGVLFAVLVPLTLLSRET